MVHGVLPVLALLGGLARVRSWLCVLILEPLAVATCFLVVSVISFTVVEGLFAPKIGKKVYREARRQQAVVERAQGIYCSSFTFSLPLRF